MCRGDRPVAPTGAGDGDQQDCAEPGAPASVSNCRERRLESAMKCTLRGCAPSRADARNRLKEKVQKTEKFRWSIGNQRSGEG